MRTDLLFSEKRMSGLWKAIVLSKVPVVDKYEKKQLAEVLLKLKKSIKTNKYLPDVPIGYLGMPKGVGVTRFIPIITAEDLLVYYLSLIHI